MVDIAELLSDQPLINEGDGDGGEELLDTGSELQDGGDYENNADDDQGGEEPPEGGRKQRVPLAALHEERTKRQELQTQLQAQQEQQRVLNERLTRILEAQQQQQIQQQQPAPEAPPSFEDDPVAAFNHLQNELVRSQQQMQQYLQGNYQQVTQQQQFQQLVQEVTAQEAQFKAVTPDYDAAHTHFTARKVAEYKALGMDDVMANQQLAKDYTGIAQIAKQQGKNPAEMLYNLAKVHGYNGSQAPGAGQQRKAPPTSLSNASGTPRAPDEKGAVTASDISQMSDKEFDEFFNGMKRSGIQKPKY